MVLVVFLLAYVIRQRLDRLGVLSSDDLWRSWLHIGTRSKAGKEGSLFVGLLLVLGPAVLLGALVLAAGYGGIRVVVYPVELIVLVLMMGVPGWRPVLEAYTEAWGHGDMQGAWHHIEDCLPEDERGSAQSAEAMHLSISRALMVSVFERFFLRSEEHTSELQSRPHLVCRLL